MEADLRSPELERTARISNAEGIFGQVHLSLTVPPSIFVSKFAVMLGATPLQFGILSAIGQVGQVFQLLGVSITRGMTSRKGPTVRLMAVARAFAPFYALLPFLLPRGTAMWAFLFLFLVSTSLLAMGTNIWVAWISDMVPLSVRGRFLSRRSQYMLVAGLLTGYVCGVFIDMFGAEPPAIARAITSALRGAASFVPAHLPYAFLAVFGLAAVSGLIGSRVLNLQPEHPKPVERESLGQMLRVPLRDGNFRRLLLYTSWWMLAVGVASPFWQPFMIEKLRLSMVTIQVYGTISTAASLLALRPWGILIDRFGNKTAMRFAIVLGGINPLIWVFAQPGHYWFIFIEAATSGVMWAGAGVVATNFVLSVAPEGRRQVYSGMFGAFSGLAMMVTMLLSGAFLPSAVTILGLHLEPEQVLFAITGISRWTTQIPLSWVQEPTAQPVGAVLHYLQGYAKIRIAPVMRWRRARGRRQSD